MKLATFKTSKGTSYGAVTDKGIVDLGARLKKYPDLLSLIAGNGFKEAAGLLSNVDFKTSDVTWLPVIPNPGKILCVGLNYQDHVVETGRDNTEQPAIFIRVAESQVGHRQPIIRPKESTHMDFEAEIAVIIGKPGRRISQKDSWNHIYGYSCYNDGSVRDWQRHTIQWTAGKIPPKTRKFRPCRVNGER